jgi:hypothetical protein
MLGDVAAGGRISQAEEPACERIMMYVGFIRHSYGWI